MSEDRGFSAASVALSFLLGGAMGACVALLLAPDNGRKTRERLRGLAGEARERTLDAAEDLRDRVEDAIDQGRGLLDEKKTTLTAAYQAGRDAFQRERDRLQTP
jgi:gas vesicle protein